jgi:hypothetical protein
MAKVYLVEREDLVGYDENRAFVVVANTPDHARQLCKENAADEGKEVWNNALCILLAKGAIDRTPRVVLSDFNAG